MMAIAWTKAALALMPRIITRRSVIKNAPRRFREQYTDGARRSHTGESYSQMHEKLASIDLETCDRSAIDDVIGNNSWTQLTCEICDCDREALVSIPREYSEPISICLECAKGVQAVFEDAQS